MKKIHDDYNWEQYTSIYTNQTKEMMVNDKYEFVIKDSYVKDDKIIFLENVHENWRDIYNKILELKVSSVMECGCGPGHHLYNIKKLFPTIDIFGIELLESQCHHGYVDLKIPAEFYENISIGDFTIPNMYSEINRTYEFVFTQAVTQHLNHEKVITFIKNMADVSHKYILLKENLNNHDYKSVFEESGILERFNLSIIPGTLCPSMFLVKK